MLCNRYDFPIVEFKMARRQGASREHVLWSEPDWHHLRPRSNADAGPFQLNPPGRSCLGEFAEKISLGQYHNGYRRLALEIRPNSLRRLGKPYLLHNTKEEMPIVQFRGPVMKGTIVKRFCVLSGNRQR